MGILLLLLAAEATIITLQKRAREEVLKKWLEGSLTMEELLLLKRKLWFQKIWNPTEERIPREKKTN